MNKNHLQYNILSKPYNRTDWQGVLTDVFGTKTIFSPARPIDLAANDIAEAAFELGNFYTADERLVGIYEIILKTDAKTKININRVGLRSLLANIYKYDVDGALVVFTLGNKWRFSYISEITTAEGKKQTEPKRYTYLFGEGESCRTAADRFMKLQGKKFYLQDLYEAFSVEKLNDEFFVTYKGFYEKFWHYLNNDAGYRAILIDKKETEPVKQEKPIRDFAKKLLGRIVFLHFLQKKGWMGCPLLTTEHENETVWKDGKPQFMQMLFSSSNNQQHFHSTALRTLFFETLNTKRADNTFSIPLPQEDGGTHTLTRVPYLNGGLFDKDISAAVDLDFPAEYFSSLFGFFEQYNFTIDENDPYDSEVGIDPEMLGHIFENLLEENRDKGTFYTPKEIVQYMCRESLLQYLRTYLPECIEDDSPATRALEQFITANHIDDRGDRKNFVVRSAKRIEGLLERVKICDPAIGSGAFPMGMLQQIFKARMALDLTLDRAAVKKDIIQKNIYGVDIESGAVDIARLRFWLALVVDEEAPQPLPNLDYKIMQGNSLFESFEMVDLKFEQAKYEIKLVKEVDLFGKPLNPQISITEYLRSKAGAKEFDLTELEEKYFNSNNAQEKQEIKRKIDVFEKEFIEQQIAKRQDELDILIKGKKGTVEKKKLKELEQHIQEKAALEEVSVALHEMTPNNKPYFLWHLYFMDVFKEGGFHIIIGNPPYLRIQGIRKDNPKMADQLSEKYKAATGSFDLYALFVEMGLGIMKTDGILNYIMPVKWANAAFGEGLRDVISTDKFAFKIISFEAYQVFNVSTYTALQWFKKGSEYLQYYQLNEDIKSNEKLGVFLKDINNAQYSRIKYSNLSKSPWVLTDGSTGIILDKLNKQQLRVENVFERFFTGLQTSKDSVYFIMNSAVQTNQNLVKGYSKELDKDVVLEIGILKPLLKGDQVHRYEFLHTANYVIFPYKILDDKVELYTEEEIKTKFPKAYLYLKENESALRMRENGKLKNDLFWYKYIYPKNLNLFQKPKIIGPDISLGSNYAFDEFGEFYDTTTLYGYLKYPHIQLSYKYLLAILNSKVCWFFLKNTGTVLANGYFRFMPHYINPYPLVEAPETESKLIEQLVNKVILLKKEKKETANWENKIDAIVFHLYGLTEDEMLQVLDNFNDLSIRDRNQIHNEYRNIRNKHFNAEV